MKAKKKKTKRRTLNKKINSTKKNIWIWIKEIRIDSMNPQISTDINIRITNKTTKQENC